jgi:hypothetical protein
MKKIAILLIPFILFLGFLSFKPPAVTAANDPATPQITTEAVPSTPSPTASKKVLPKPPVIEDGDEDHEPGRRPHKPGYGGHDDDDFDDDHDD